MAKSDIWKKAGLNGRRSSNGTVMGDGALCCAGLHHQSQNGRPEHGAEGGLLRDPGLCFSKSMYTCNQTLSLFLNHTYRAFLDFFFFPFESYFISFSFFLIWFLFSYTVLVYRRHNLILWLVCFILLPFVMHFCNVDLEKCTINKDDHYYS